MLEPPSAPLVTLLRELRLCTPADLRRCRGRVRRMATDLPAFDSVWIDALVQLRRLTPFQAQVLESPHPDQLRVGPCVLVDRLGSSFAGANYLARSIATRQARGLKVVNVEEDRVAEILARGEQLLASGRKFVHPSIVLPQACEQFGDRLVFVSRHVPGRTLTELLVRRGRFPASVVWQIGRQLAEGLARLHANGLAHGDIRPSQVRLLSEGTAVLVEAGIQGVLEPELTPHSQLVPECYDCVAPELIGTGITYNPLSDLYALGCLLWQLLAGRPPFPGGDPLAKLAAHQTRRIRDVRDFAPDTPPKLAELILRLTSPNLGDRPPSADAVLKVWGAPRYAGRRLLKRFVGSFERPVGDGLKLATVVNSPLVWTLALLFAVSGLTASYVHEGTRATLLRIWASMPQATTAVASGETAIPPTEQIAIDSADQASTVSTQVGDQLLPLPEPDTQGVIQLNSPGPYAVRNITQVGPLTIRAREGIQAEIVLADRPLFLLAEQVQLQRLCFRRTAAAGANPTAQVLVESLELDVRDCQFLSESTVSTADLESPDLLQQSTSAEICWQVPDAAGPQSGAAVLQNLSVSGNSPLLDLRSGAKKITFSNVLRLGPGSLLNLKPPRETRLQLELVAEHVTCRQSGSLLAWSVRDDKPPKHEIKIQARDCVFEILASQGALLEFAGDRHISECSQQVNFEGYACVVSDDTEIAATRDPQTGTLVPLDSSELALEGITQGGYSFAGVFGPSPVNSAIGQDYEGVRNAQLLPGIIADQLPVAGLSSTRNTGTPPRLSSSHTSASSRSLLPR